MSQFRLRPAVPEYFAGHLRQFLKIESRPPQLQLHLEPARHAQTLDGRRDERKNDGFLQPGKLVEEGADYELLAEPLFHPLLKIVIDGKDHPGVGE